MLHVIMLHVNMLNVTYKPFLLCVVKLSVIMLNAIMVSVMVPFHSSLIFISKARESCSVYPFKAISLVP